MKKITLILLMITLFMITGCKDDKQKNLYLPEAKNDKIYTTIGGESGSHKGEGYTITVPEKDYHYEKEYDDGALEEKWEYTKKDDVEIKVTTYKNSDEISARTKFLKDYDEYIFEDLLGQSLCGIIAQASEIFSIVWNTIFVEFLFGRPKTNNGINLSRKNLKTKINKA